MNTVSSAFALLCITLIPASAFGCDINSCNQFCTVGSECSFSCGDAKNCTQGCLERTCQQMTCGAPATNCKQYCNNCEGGIKMLCTSDNCVQSCTAEFCDMECASNVKTCQQICVAGSTCKITCNNDTTDCQLACEEANCTGVPEELEVSSSCDELTENCTRTCTSACSKETLSCGNDKFTECHLSCKDGCKMVCDKSVKKCVQTCIGDTPCTSVCEASEICKKDGKFHSPTSSAMVCHLNYFMFVLLACIMIFQLKKL